MKKPSKNQKIQSRIIVFVQIAISFIFAIAYLSFYAPTLNNFLIFGLLSVIANVLIYLVSSFLLFKKLADENVQTLTTIVGGLTRVIPFSIYYIAIAVKSEFG
jgi:ABC-type multidrug transport system permease subunit